MLKNADSRREEEEQMERESRLPPGQALTQKFPVLHYGPIPTFDPATWDLRVWGEVEREVSWSWEEFQELPRQEARLDVHCVTRWSKFDTLWEGVSVKMLLDEGFLQLKPSAQFLLQHCEYGFTVNIPLEVALSENFLLATHFDGVPLTPEHGFPLRAVVGAVPNRKDLKDVYFWKGGKWLRGLEFRAQDKLGFWEQAGYHNEANIWKEERLQRSN